PTSRVNIGLYTFNSNPNPAPVPTPTPVDTFVGTTAKLAYTKAGGVRLEMEVRALESESLADEVASPHLVVANNPVAFIKDVEDVPYNQATAS
ncbi:type IV pilus secretin PilQ family protein, partial [Francisella tularensis subsp. holarctica]|nr:type IV pilus secretin PilQ family protein [Francisella tularensis subsp. holarctica]